MHLIDLIIAPIITEKSELIMNEKKIYTFEVHNKATKPQIKKALQMIYGEAVTKINVASIIKQFGRGAKPSRSTKRNCSKKAMVYFGGNEINYAMNES